MLVSSIIAALALLLCALLGLGALLAPRWAQGVVRLQPDPAPGKEGGFSEFRATYGGLLFMIHMTALAVLFTVPPAFALFALMPVAAGWFGAGIGRLVSYLVDTRANRGPGMMLVWIPMELALGLAIAAPVLQLG
jgi:hypothetical protein